MEVTVKIMPDSEANAFSMTYLDDGGSFGVQLSPDSIKVGGLAPDGFGYHRDVQYDQCISYILDGAASQTATRFGFM